jgi:TolA-binding protein
MHDLPWRLREPAVSVAVILVTGLAGGCGAVGGTKSTEATQAPADPMAALRQDVDRLRADLGGLRTRVEAAQRSGTEHADRVALETREEFDAVQKAMEASARNDVQRQVEAVEAQARRIDLLERQAAELSQTLRRVELGLAGIESRLVRAPDPPAATPAPGTRSGAPKVASPARATPDDAARMAKAAPPTAETKAPGPERGPGTAPSRQARTDPPSAAAAAGTLTARALFDRATESWNKGEQGQAVLDFEELVKKFPWDPLAGPAQFRIGEAYFTARDFDRAAIEYRRAVDLAPKGKDTPRALLRLGLAYRAQKRESDARQAWNQLVREFPDSEVTEEARRALRGR